MKKEKTLYEKRISWHEEGISYNGKVFKEVHLTNGDKILREKDVKQFIKDVREIVETDYVKEIKIKAIKQKAGFEELK